MEERTRSLWPRSRLQKGIAQVGAAAIATALLSGGLISGIGYGHAVASEPSGRSVGYDRTYKADLVDRLSEAPQVVVLGGSRSQRFEPSLITKLTGLSAFNFAVQNCRPEDAYAISRYLYARAPTVKLRCIYCVQCTSFVDAPMNPGLLYDKRLSAWFPKALIAKEKAAEGTPTVRNLLSCNQFTARGCLLHNTYDRREDSGVSLDTVLDHYLTTMVPRAASAAANSGSRSRWYFRQLLALYNEHGVKPLIVIMPYHPTVLTAFRAVGWQTKLDRTIAYLRSLQKSYDFRLVDYTDIGSFGGSASWFYDGAHIKVENARLILRQAVRDAPECFR